MKKDQYTNRHQREFLRKLRDNPNGLPAEKWPSAVTLRRWWRHAGFRRAMGQLRQAMTVQADLHLMTAASRAAGGLAGALGGDGLSGDNESGIQLVRTLVQLLRLSHWRMKELAISDAATDRAERKRRGDLPELPWYNQPIARGIFESPEKLDDWLQAYKGLMADYKAQGVQLNSVDDDDDDDDEYDDD